MALIPLYSEYCASRFRKRSGEPVKLRAAQKAVARLGLGPLVIRGSGEPLIDPDLADARAVENQLARAKGPRRGRPRTA